MNDLFVAVRFDGETDAIVFSTRAECEQFCNMRPEYEAIHSGLYSVNEALSFFGDDVICPHCEHKDTLCGLVGENTNDCPRCGKPVLVQN